MKKKIARTMKDFDSYAFTMSEEGWVETLVLMHSPMGIRLEWKMEQAALSLWIAFALLLNPVTGRRVFPLGGQAGSQRVHRSRGAAESSVAAFLRIIR